MTKRRLIFMMAIPVALATILAGALYTAMHTSAGAGWILTFLENQLPGELKIAESEGDLASGLVLHQTSYTEPELSVQAARIRLAVSLELFPLAARIDTLAIQSLNVKQESDEPGQSSPEEILASLALPFPVYADDLLIEGLRLSGPDGTGKFEADRLSLKARLHDKLQIERLALEMDQNRLVLDGNLGLAKPFPVEMNSTAGLSLTLSDAGEPQHVEIQASLRGDLAQQLKLALNSQEPAITVDGSLHDLLGEPEWDLEIQSPGLSWPIDAGGSADISGESLKISSSGNLDNFALNATGQVKLRDLDPHQFNLQADGMLTGLDIHQFALQGPSLDLVSTGNLNWRDESGVHLTTVLNRLDLHAWLKEWPESHPLKGELNFSLQQQRVRVAPFHLETADSSMTVDGSGEADLELGTLASEITWKDISWPMGTEIPDIRSRLGKIQLSGNLDQWNVTGEADLESPGLPAGTLRFEATGDRDQAALTIVDSRVLGGLVHGDAEFNWVAGQQWSARLVAEDLATHELHPALPGSLNANLTASGKLEPFHLDLDIRRLEGEIRKNQMAAAGRVQVEPGNLDFTDMQLSSAKSIVKLNGSTSSEQGVAFTANIADLGSFLAHSSGSIEAAGRLSLKPGNPVLRLDLEGQELIWEEFHLPLLSIHDYADPNADDIARLRLEARDLQFSGQMLEYINLEADLTHSNQALRMTLSKSSLELSAGMDGSLLYKDRAFQDFEWAGQLNSLTLNEGSQNNLTLLQPAGIELSADLAAIRAACLGAGADSKLCLDADWRQDGSLNTGLKLTRFPLELIQSLLDTDLEMSQLADGELSWESPAKQPPSGHASIQLSAGEVRYAGETDSLFSTGQGLIGFELNDGVLSAGNFDIPLPGLGEIDLDFNIPNAIAGLDSKVEGRLKVDLNDLDLLAVLIPAINQAEGRFDANLVLSGSPARPFFSGPLSLSNAMIVNEATGLRLSDIQLSGDMIGSAKTQLTGSFRAREGTGSMQAFLDFSDVLSPRVELSLRGENLTLLDAPDLKVVAVPDVKLAWQDDVININGSLLIPTARIAPSVLPESTVSTSPDLVIVAGEIPGSKVEDKSLPKIAIRGEFEIVLGNGVELDLSVAEADVDGSVKFTWQDNLIPLANGSFRMVGEIQAFGQLLQITEANIGFPGIPADNPHLNIRAERQIYGNSEIRRAGVFVTGTLRRPIIEPYTDPMTNRERAQTLLITGSDFNMETGVGAVDIGTYIAPRVFVSYGIGVFEDENVISIRYDLGRNWGVKATSGERQTGIDMSYTIER